VYLLLSHWTGSRLITSISSLDIECLGFGGVVRNDYGDWIAGFIHYEVGGVALLVELRAIQIGLDSCRKKGYDNNICESDCLEAVELIIDGCDHTLHTCSTDIVHMRDAFQGNDDATLVHILREQNMCADFMVKEGSDAR